MTQTVNAAEQDRDSQSAATEASEARVREADAALGEIDQTIEVNRERLTQAQRTLERETATLEASQQRRQDLSDRRESD